jgi:hypothetical protein
MLGASVELHKELLREGEEDTKMLMLEGGCCRVYINSKEDCRKPQKYLTTIEHR